jgi:hypothetical protein
MPNLDDLRVVLFEQLKRVQDPKEKFDAARTRAITDIAGRLLDSARLEIDYAHKTKKPARSNFLAVTETAEQSAELLEEKQEVQPESMSEPKKVELGAASGESVYTASGIKTVVGNVLTHKLR